eukprot:4196529-Amphidinium_carterae.3
MHSDSRCTLGRPWHGGSTEAVPKLKEQHSTTTTGIRCADETAFTVQRQNKRGGRRTKLAKKELGSNEAELLSKRLLHTQGWQR